MFHRPSEIVQDAAFRKTFRLLVAYDGTDYFGWQVQPGLPTIQGALATAVRQVTGEGVLPQGSGRTDTGVHAEGQAVSLSLRADIPADRLHRALNRRLPPSIRILSLQDAPETFHARSSVLHKTYEYRIFERRAAGCAVERICLPPMARFAWDCRWPLQLDRMEQAASDLCGTRDFTSLTATDPDRTRRLDEAGTPQNNNRTVFTSTWARMGEMLVYRVCGSGFLHHMVRNIVGTCVDVGAGRLPADAFRIILPACDRRAAGPTAPPQGLHLVQVVYTGDADERLQTTRGVVHA